MGDSLKKGCRREVGKHSLKLTESLTRTKSLDFRVDFVAGIALADVCIAAPIVSVLIEVIRRIVLCIKKSKGFSLCVSAGKIDFVAEKSRYIHYV